MIHEQACVTFHTFDCGTLPVEVSISRFRGASGVEEYHLMARPVEYASAEVQLDWISRASHSALRYLELDAETQVFRRVFCSDLSNQAPALISHPLTNPHNLENPCAVSWICQPPAPPAKLAIWAYHVNEPGGVLNKSKDGCSLLLKRDRLSHIWTTGVTCSSAETPYDQTKGIFSSYEDCLEANHMTLSEHVIRTWFFLQNVDSDYPGFASARKEVFQERGLTPDTHFIASTGIGGGYPDSAVKVAMDAYAVSGVRDSQIEFLTALDHLSPTHIYGVTFERGVSVSYRDRKHVIISGTASIDHEGKIVHSGDVLRQLDRTVENISALLKQAGAALQDVCVLTVYVRDPSDLAVIRQEVEDRFKAAPAQVVTAPICRPGWLVEIECQAIIPVSNPALPSF